MPIWGSLSQGDQPKHEMSEREPSLLSRRECLDNARIGSKWRSIRKIVLEVLITMQSRCLLCGKKGARLTTGEMSIIHTP